MNARTFLKVASLSLFWGPTFLYINLAVKEIPPLTLGAARYSIAAIILFAILKLQGRALPKDKTNWKHFVVAGLTHNALPFVLASWGQLHIDSVLAAVLFGTTPLFTMLMSRLLNAEEPLGSARIIGATIGFAGVFILFMPGFAGGVQTTFWGMAALIGSAISVGLALVYTQKHLRGMPPLVAPAGQVMTAPLFLVPLSLTLDQSFSLPMPSLTALSALLLLAVLGTAVAYIIYFRIQETVSATNMSLITYLNPVVATILGILILGETFGPTTFMGSGLILFGAAVVNGIKPPKFPLKPHTQPQPCSNQPAPIPC